LNLSKREFWFVDDMPGLQRLANDFISEKTIAVDLEADSMFHFSEKICLIQIASAKTVALIDPLKIKDLSCLRPLFFQEDIRKVFHGADYDVRSLYRDFGIHINNLFDTELACRFLGMKETGLEAVLNNLFDVRLDKKYQKTDWSRRPLPENMLEYAVKDVLHLIPLSQYLTGRLENAARLSWVEEESRLLSGVRPLDTDHQPLYLRFKGAGTLGPRKLAALEELLQFRRRIAKKEDKPLFRILGNQSLLRIAGLMPCSLKALDASEILGKKEMRTYGAAVVESVAKARKFPQKDLPVYPRKKCLILSDEEKKRMKALAFWREEKANLLKIDPFLISSKALMVAIAKKNPRLKQDFESLQEMRQWQKKEFADDLLDVLRKT